MGVPRAEDNVAGGDDQAEGEDVVGDDARLEAGAVRAHGDDAGEGRVGDGAEAEQNVI